MIEINCKRERAAYQWLVFFRRQVNMIKGYSSHWYTNHLISFV
jgi:hypothetical protein